MSAINVNQEGYQRRMDVVQSILRKHNLESSSVTTLAYVEHCPFAFNNFIYKIVLSQPLTPSTFGSKSQRPGTIAPTADGISTIVIRLSNPHAEGLNNANRVENELAAQVLLRQHLITSHPDLAYLIPAVYAWQPCRYPDVSDESGFAWTMCEYKPGADLDAEFNKMELSEKLEVVGQVAIIFTALKKTPLPEPLKVHLGGLTFNDEGEVVGGQMPLLPTGPWQTYEDLWVSRLNQQLHEADKSSALQGWRRDGLRERIDQFIVAPNIASLLDGVDTMQRALIHNDMTLNNMLFDKTTKRVTALLDFDFAGITHPVHEFFTGLWDIGGATHNDIEQIRFATITGIFEEADERLSAEDKDKWEIAKAWNSALAAQGTIRPSTIQGIEKLDKLRQLEEVLCPHHLGSSVMVERMRRKTPEKEQEIVQAAADKVVAFLEDLGA